MRVPRSPFGVALGPAAIVALGLLVLALGRPVEAADGPAGLHVAVQESPAPSPTPDPLEVAKALARLRFDDDARAQLKKALEADPSRSIPPELEYLRLTPTPTPTATPTPTPHPIDVARALAQAGFDAEARSSLKKALEVDPTSVPPELAYLNDHPFPDWQAIANPWTRAVVISTNFAIVLVVIALIVAAISRVARRRLDVADFDHDAVGDLKLGKAVAALIEQEMVELRREGGGNDIQFVSGPDPALDVPAAFKELATPVKFLSAALALVPSRVYRISGQLQPAAERGVGLTISVQAPSGEVLQSATLWERDFDPDFKVSKSGAPTRGQEKGGDETGVAAATARDARDLTQAYYRLGVAAAGWILYALPLDPDERARAHVLTSDPQSYALFRAAVAWGAARERARARRLYVQALALDPLNAGALLNVGNLDGGENKYASAIDRLDLALRLTEERERQQARPRVAGGHDRLWYRASYGLAVNHFHAALEASRADRDQQLDQAIDRGRLLLLAASSTLLELDSARFPYYLDRSIQGAPLSTPGEKEGFTRFLESVESATAVFLADALATKGGLPRIEPRRPGPLELLLSWIARVIWDLFGKTPALKTQPAPSAVHPPKVDKRQLRRELAASLSTGATAPRDLIAFVKHDGVAALSYRTRYNLACYYAQRGGENLESAWRELEFGLERGDHLIDWSTKDPSLKPLREANPDRFEKIRAARYAAKSS